MLKRGAILLIIIILACTTSIVLQQYCSHNLANLILSFIVTSVTIYFFIFNEKRELMNAKNLKFQQVLLKLNEDFAETNQELEQFVYVASHDLQEPLRKMMSFSTLLEEDCGENLTEAIEEDIYFIQNATIRMQSMIMGLLALSRTGSAALQRERTNIACIVEEVVDSLSILIEETNTKIIIDSDMPIRYVDRILVAQMYQNLISNAIKFNKSSERIVYITYQNQDGEEVFGVKDNGIGIDSQYLDQIFTAFKRLHPQHHYEGSGIGLAVCEKVVEGHDGKIWAESEVDKGTHFKFTLGGRRWIAQ